MASDDMRYHLELYGIHYNDWEIDFGTFADHHKILVEKYINDATSTTETSEASDTNKFIYPFHVKKIYFIEGIIEGQITVASSTTTSTVTSYRVSVGKVNDNTDIESELFSTGWVTVADSLAWDSTYSIGTEMVYAFWIDAWEKEELDEFDRIYVNVEINADDNAVIWHSNDSTYNDIFIDVPLRL